MKTAAVVLAAGLSRRLGRPKQLLTADGRLVLAMILETILTTRLEPVVVVLGHRASEVRAALEGSFVLTGAIATRLNFLINHDYASGQAGSIKTGLRYLGPEVEAAMFLMADQVRLKSSIIEMVLRRAEEPDQPRVVRPRYGGEPGGPVLWARSCFQDLARLTGDQGGRFILAKMASEDMVYLDLKAEDNPGDLDTEADYVAWLEERSRLGERP
ncbi:MAG: nucleotidyltransferase family protein [Thermodesulfobacteriota bacterium]